MKVEVEGEGAGDYVVLSRGHTEGVQDVSTEPDRELTLLVPWPDSIHLLKDWSGFRPFMLASGIRIKSLPSVLQVLAVLQSLLQPTPFRSQPSGEVVGFSLQNDMHMHRSKAWYENS